MQYKQIRKRVASLLFTLTLILTFMPVNVLADNGSYRDISGHWAKDAIIRWSDYGILKGSNGYFRPDDTVTRAELATILQRMLKYPEMKDNPFKDVNASNWYGPAVLALAKYDIVRSDDAKIDPNEAIDREEAAFMIGKAFGVKPYKISYKEFRDSNDISAWAGPFICAMYYYGFVNGTGDGLFQPKNNVTRAQVVTILNNMVDTFVSAPGTYEVTGADARVLVNCDDVTLKFSACSTIELFISPGADGGILTEDFSGCGNDLKMTQFNVGTSIINASQIPPGGALSGQSVYPTLVFTSLSESAVDTGFAGGKGTPDDPYLIRTQEQLRHLDSYYAADYGYYCSPYLYFKLDNDITLSGNWIPIADQSRQIKLGHSIRGFYGELNGAGHIVSYSIQADDSHIKDPGLFGGLCGLVRNLNVKASISGTSDYWSEIGGIAGVVSAYGPEYGSIQNCSAETLINASGNRVNAGGIAGSSLGTISGCSAKVTINLVGKAAVFADGIVGKDYGNTDDCSSVGCVTAVCHPG